MSQESRDVDGVVVDVASRAGGVYANSDLNTPDFIGRCLDSGVGVPESVAVLGAGTNGIRCDLAPVPLSGIELDLERKGERVARRLADGEDLRLGPGDIAAHTRGMPRRFERTRRTRFRAFPDSPEKNRLR